MLPLDSPRWTELRHAYGSAQDVPIMLRTLDVHASSSDDAEPWISIWSALAHQGDVYSASFAAVPHIVATLGTDPARADISFLHFPTWVEICRRQRNVSLPDDLCESYRVALRNLMHLAVGAVEQSEDESRIRVASAAVAAARGQPDLAEAILELEPAIVKAFMDSRYEY